MNFAKKINITIAIIAIISFLLIFFLVRSFFFEIKNVSQNFLAQKEKLVFLTDKLESLQKFEGYFGEIKPNLEKIDAFFVDAEAPVEFIGFLENTAKNCEVSLKISPPQNVQKTEKDPWPFLNFQVSSTGYFSKFSKFLEKLESSQYLIEIQNLNVSRTSKTEASSSVDVTTNLTLKVYTK